MDCTEVAGHLVAYHFATADDEERDGIDAHLLECRACLRTYLALKRANEKRPLEKPSAAARARLRAEVAKTFPTKTRIAIFARRIPLYQGIALAAVAAMVALALPSLVRRSAHDVREGIPEVDTARPRAESLQIY